ncbi:WWE protein-protein interaction domain protein family [Striga asiatica]|uniref:WWE protein-protein interaction domain protein family n=1 Tax=Striga asiatica TaxID=4170 RepID=A0A5A7R6P6_STRAF|nr:WWE protein-protein interaction domain protein family [Striga asiatica]
MVPFGNHQENSKLSAQKLSPLHTNNPHDSNSDIDQDSCPSDCESSISGPENEQPQLHGPQNDFVTIHKGEMIYETIAKKLVTSLSSRGLDPRVESIYRNRFSSINGRARVESFGVYSRAVQTKCGGNANLTYAWFGASKNEIDMIIDYGFGLPRSGLTHGRGVYLYSINHPIESVQSALPDENGLRHILLCRVILGKTELISPGSQQNNPSSEEFDSGVDNIETPQKYIVWTSRMNTHILPEFLVSFRALPSNSRGSRPNSNRMPFPTLINVLTKYLPCDAVELIRIHHSDFRKQKITRSELVRRVRHIAGDKLLIKIMKSCKRKKSKVCLNSDMKLI